MTSMKKNIHFILNPSEITAGTRGASLGPEAVIAAARTKGSTLFGQHRISKLSDKNYLIDIETSHQFAKRIDGLDYVFTQLNTALKDTTADEFPLIIAGDHGSAAGTIAALKSKFPEKRLGVVWIDAHADIHSPYTTPSGNMHGMPLAIALNEDNLACQCNEIPTETLTLWNELKAKGVSGANVLADDLVYVAVRDTEEQEDKIIEQLDITRFSVDDITLNGEEKIVRAILDKLAHCDHIYISFDVDSMDPQATSHGTGTPVDKGLLPSQAQNIILNLLKSDKVSCLEIVEVNPCLDENINKMAETAFDILEQITEQLTK